MTDTDRLPLFLYDGNCGICSSFARWMTRRIRCLPRVEPYQAVDLTTLGLTPEECALAVQWIGRDRSIRRGHDAIAQVLIDAGNGWTAVGRVLRLPGISTLSAIVYRLVARNRHRLPTGDSTCSVTPNIDNDATTQRNGH